MDENLSPILESLANAAVLTAIFGGIMVWLTILRRVLTRRPLVPFQRRRPVPWGGLDVLGILLAYVCLASTLVLTAHAVLGWDYRDPGDHLANTPPIIASDDQPQDTAEEEPASSSNEEPSKDSEDTDDEIDLQRAHPVVVLLSGDSSPGTLLLCLFAVVVMAPLAEEIFFRLLLQGYFEKVDYHCQRLWRYSGRLVGVVPILLSSLLFAALHAREPEGPKAAEQLIRLFAVDTFAKVLLVTGAIAYLKMLRGATWEDLGLRLDTFWKDLGLAIAGYVAVIVPIYILQETLGRLLPDTVPDPFPLFFFALALGYLYFRTHRLMPAILLHLIFNATALGMFFAMT